MSNLPEKFTIPEDRIPKPWAQNQSPTIRVGSCVACTFTKILEVINYVKTGVYVYMSKGYMYVRNNHPDKNKPGMYEEYTLNMLLKRGSVPEEMCTDYGELPEIREIIEKREDIAELDRVAEKYAIKAWEEIPGNAQRFQKIKEYLYKYQMPLAGFMPKYQGEPHFAVICGWDGDSIIWQNHDKEGKLKKTKQGNFTRAFYLDGGIEEKQSTPEEEPSKETKQEENEMGYKLIDVSEFKNYIDSLNITRKITVVQLHHTYSPEYKDFKGNNHIALQEGMRNYHIKTRGFADIAQTFTIFPDGKICTGRDVNIAPAGVYGSNSTGICIECIGNFDKGGDTMSDAQKNAIVGVTKILLDRFGLDTKNGVTYHAWWTSGGTSLGTYVAGKSAKTCPGTNFFGGNTREAFEKNLLPLIEKWGKPVKKMLESANDITWELNHTYFPIDDADGFKKVLDEAKENNSPLYWGYYKLVNRIK